MREINIHDKHLESYIPVHNDREAYAQSFAKLLQPIQLNLKMLPQQKIYLILSMVFL